MNTLVIVESPHKANTIKGFLGKGYKVKAIDTVAAGDSFNGAFAVAITEGKSEEDAVAFANAMGALTVQKEGAIPSLHTRKEVEEFCNQYILYCYCSGTVLFVFQICIWHTSAISYGNCRCHTSSETCKFYN